MSSSQRNYAARTHPSSIYIGTSGKGDYTWRSERQLILTFLSENQSVVIPEAACVISSLLPHPLPGFVSLPRLSLGDPSATPGFRPLPRLLFPFPISSRSTAFPIRLIRCLAPFRRLSLYTQTKGDEREREEDKELLIYY